MEQEAPILPVDRLHGVGIVVSDLKRSLNEFSRFFGIGEWSVRRLVSGKDFTIGGPSGDIQGELLWASGGTPNLHFDIVEPVRGDTCFKEFITRRGPGVQDVSTNVLTPAQFSAAVPELAREGVGILQSLRFPKLEVHYLDSADYLGTVVKILVPHAPGTETLAGVPIQEVVRHEVPPQAQRLPIDRPYHFCVLTKHRRLSVQQNFRRLFGIERWFEFDNEVGRTTEEAHYFGAPIDAARFKLACGRRERFSVEIVENLYGQGAYRDMLQNKGEGIHHIMTTMIDQDRLRQATAALAPEGYSMVLDGAAAGTLYYGYFGAQGKLADLAVEVLGPLGDGDLKAVVGDDAWAILQGPAY